MKSGLVTIDPSIEAGASFQSFCNALRFFQEHGLISQTSVGSVVHPNLYLLPYRFYKEFRGTYIKEANAKLQTVCADCLDYDTIRILPSESLSKEDHINQLARCAHRLGRDLLILASHDRVGLSHLLLGSYSETATLMAKIPVFVIKPSFDLKDFANKQARFVLAVDAASPPSGRAVRWVADFAKPANVTIDLLYVRPRKKVLIDSLQERKPRQAAEQVLGDLQKAFAKYGFKANSIVLDESHSVAETVAEHSENEGAWVTICSEAIRSKSRKLLLGSTARKILLNTKRPFLSLRMV